MRFDHVPARTVRFWASLDSAVGGLVATPWGAQLFLGFLYWANGRLGGTAEAPLFTPLQLLFVCLMGALVSVWVVARWLHPVGLMAVIDGWGRSYVALLIVWFLLFRDAEPILWLFVFTEGIGGLAQLRTAYFRKP
jgi:hypothetical protein